MAEEVKLNIHANRTPATTDIFAPKKKTDMPTTPGDSTDCIAVTEKNVTANIIKNRFSSNSAVCFSDPLFDATQSRFVSYDGGLVEKWTWRSFVNEQPKGDSISKQWRVTAWPTTFLIDAEGVIRYRGLRGESLDAAIETLLAEIGEEVKIVGVDHEAEDEKAMEAFEKATESETEESKSTDSGS